MKEKLFAKLSFFTEGVNDLCRRAVQKVSDLWPGKIHLHAWRSATLIPFEVVFL